MDRLELVGLGSGKEFLRLLAKRIERLERARKRRIRHVTTMYGVDIKSGRS
jgi:hypothetical protein